MKPKLNRTIPLCRACHDIWHKTSADHEKLMKKLSQTKSQLDALQAQMNTVYAIVSQVKE
jgi:hypothetical protein